MIIDISENNGYIDFTKLKSQGIDGVIIRIGWIGSFQNHTIDKYFNEYYKKAKEQNLKIGFYVYNYCRIMSNFTNAINWIKNIIINKDYDLPIFLDMEDTSIQFLGKENLTNQCIQFCNSFKNSGIYANKNWFNNLLDFEKIKQYKIWLAEWTIKSKPSFNKKYDLWQYTDKGHIKGIVGNVDCNKIVYNVDNPVDNLKNERYVDMKQYINGSKSENVYSDTNLSKKIGSLDKFESCECLGIQSNRAIVLYKVNKQDNYKVRFC